MHFAAPVLFLTQLSEDALASRSFPRTWTPLNSFFFRKPLCHDPAPAPIFLSIMILGHIVFKLRVNRKKSSTQSSGWLGVLSDTSSRAQWIARRERSRMQPPGRYATRKEDISCVPECVWYPLAVLQLFAC